MRLTDEQVQAIADLQYPNLNALATEVQEWRQRYGNIDRPQRRHGHPAGVLYYACERCQAQPGEWCLCLP